jgi:hypothetical protein
VQFLTWRIADQKIRNEKKKKKTGKRYSIGEVKGESRRRNKRLRMKNIGLMKGLK